MQKPIAISIGLFLFLFGLAYAKTTKVEGTPHSRTPATASLPHSE